MRMHIDKARGPDLAAKVKAEAAPSTRALVPTPLAAGVLQRMTVARPGAPSGGLPQGLRAGLEALSGLDMGDVRVHRNSEKPRALQAHAYAQGTHIHLAPGQDHQLPHEAWHVVQQKQGRVRATRQLSRVGINDDLHLEREADVMGARAMQVHAERESLETASTGMVTSGHAPVQRVEWGTVGTVLGLAGGFTAAVASGGSLPLAALGAAAAGYVGRRVGQAFDHRSLKSQSGLAAFQEANGGSNQGTLLFAHGNDGQYYMIEQQTNNRVAEAAAERGIHYVKQTRESGKHAEVRFLDELGSIAKGADVWVSKPICGDCHDALIDAGVHIKTAWSPERYHDWKAPSGQSRRPKNPTEKFRGHRSEVDRLQDWGVKDK